MSRLRNYSYSKNSVYDSGSPNSQFPSYGGEPRRQEGKSQTNPDPGVDYLETAMTSRKFPIVSIFLLSLVILSGCTHSERVETAGIPLSWHGRDLFQHQGQWAFAVDASDADEVIQLAEDAGTAFERIEGRPRGKLLLVARGPGTSDEEEILSALAGLSRLMEQPQAKLENGVLKRFGDARTSVSSSDEESDEDIREVMPLLQMVPGTIRGPENWTTFPIAGEESQAVVLPTSESISLAIDWAVERAMEDGDVGGIERLLAAPIIAVVKAIVRGFIKDFGRATIYGVHCWSVPEWNTEEREAAVRRYLEELGIGGKLDLPLP